MDRYPFITRFFVIAAVFLLFLFVHPSLAYALSEDMFPKTLEGMKLTEVIQADTKTAFGFNIPIAQGYKVIYKKEGQILFINIFQSTSVGDVEKASVSALEELIGQTVYSDSDFSEIQYTSVDRLRCPYVSYNVKEQGITVYGSIITVPKREYFITVHLMQREGNPDILTLVSIAKLFIGKLPEASTGDKIRSVGFSLIESGDHRIPFTSVLRWLWNSIPLGSLTHSKKVGTTPVIPASFTPTPKPRTTSASVTTGNETQDIEEEARRYVRMYSNSIVNFDVRLTRQVGDYALVQVIPYTDIEGAAVIVQKVGSRWVGQDMGTIFPEWEKKVPELFQF